MNREESYERLSEIESIVKRNKEPGAAPVLNEAATTREAVVESINRRRRAEMLAEHEASVDAEEARLTEAWHEKDDAEEAEYQANLEYEENQLDPEMIQEMCFETDPEDDGFSDVWKKADKTTKKAILNAIDEKLAEPGAKQDDFRIYRAVGEEYGARLKAVKKDPALAKVYRNEDARAAVAQKVRAHRQLEEERAQN